VTAAQGTAIAWCLRTATPDDDSFLLELYRSTREDLTQLGWPEEARQQLCELQWLAQRAGYATTHPEAMDQLVEVDHRPVGRILVDAGTGDRYVVDLALLPTHRGQGLGRALLEEVQLEAARDGVGVRLSVEDGNPARSLYERLGFVAISSHGLHTELRWAS
jgi:ribosomal protein S18 acetylase RimI-like enzyme